MTALIVIPTELEHRTLMTCAPSLVGCAEARFELCGFGPIAAAARSVQLIEQHRPERVCLLGIAGAYQDRVPVGQAIRATAVGSYGIGAGTGNDFISAGQMGWDQLPAKTGNEPCGVVRDLIELGSAEALDDCRNLPVGLLITACAASAHERDVEHRLQSFPSAIAEDMEGFGVALACRLCGIELSIVRGISNRAGDRDTTNWKIREALQSAARELQRWLDEVIS